jgi:hypothetical protein
MNIRSLERIFYEFEISCKSERFLRIKAFYREKNIGGNLEYIIGKGSISKNTCPGLYLIEYGIHYN